jgi:hypothetical protein
MKALIWLQFVNEAYYNEQFKTASTQKININKSLTP